MDPPTLLHLLAAAALVVSAAALLIMLRLPTYIAAATRGLKAELSTASSHALILALGLAPWSWLPLDALAMQVDVFFVCIGASVCLRVAMFTARVHGFRTGAAEARQEVRWCALALGFLSCALLWFCVALDEQGLLPAAFTPTAWECTPFSVLKVPPGHAGLLLVYNALLAAHCLVWVVLIRRPSARLSRALKSTVSEDFSPLSTAMFNAKQAYLWLLLIVAGALRFPDGLVSICLYGEVLHTFKSLVLNLRICPALFEQRAYTQWLAQGFAVLPPVGGTMAYEASKFSGLAGIGLGLGGGWPAVRDQRRGSNGSRDRRAGCLFEQVRG